MVDPGRVQALLDRLRAETTELRELGSRGEAILDDPDALAAAKYRFIVAIEACIDVAEHVIASEGLPAPSSFAESFERLGDAGLIDERLAGSLPEMARFRNLLVHGYMRVDDVRVTEILQTRLGDFDEFARQIAALASD